MAGKKLTPKQRVFVNEYLIDLNAAAACIRAGFKHPDIGRRLITKSHVSDAISQAMTERQKRTEITQDAVLRELALLGFQNIQNLFDNETGKLIPINKLPEDVGKTIQAVEVTSRPVNDEGDIENTTKIKTWDKKGSLELLGRHLTMFTDKVEHSGNIEISNRIIEARKRVKMGAEQ